MRASSPKARSMRNLRRTIACGQDKGEYGRHLRRLIQGISYERRTAREANTPRAHSPCSCRCQLADIAPSAQSALRRNAPTVHIAASPERAVSVSAHSDSIRIGKRIPDPAWEHGAYDCIAPTLRGRWKSPCAENRVHARQVVAINVHHGLQRCVGMVLALCLIRCANLGVARRLGKQFVVKRGHR